MQDYLGGSRLSGYTPAGGGFVSNYLLQITRIRSTLWNRPGEGHKTNREELMLKEERRQDQCLEQPGEQQEQCKGTPSPWWTLDAQELLRLGRAYPHTFLASWCTDWLKVIQSFQIINQPFSFWSPEGMVSDVVLE